ncbi:adenylate/guanylate cyclase domain-containing protein, partial [Oscillochloris sp. ZM17-4]|uniref:adenylate/guanylate cyclase domain-containing protein n=1 Tax=Oscillochloris sp. ZM17-4 TaxID=2866714 RepID=UPI001C72EADC
MQDDPQAYLPQDRRAALALGAPLPGRALGAVIFTDVTGFTPLTDTFTQALGPRRGAEELTALLNQVYSVLIAQIEAFGGSVISFSGDAMTCWFADRGLGVKGWGLGAAHRAVACALAMREAMGVFDATPTPGGPAALRVKTAIAYGAVRRFQIGDPAIQLLDTLAGSTLDRLAASAKLAEQADVIVDDATLDLLRPAVIIAARRADPQTGARAASISALARPIAPAGHAWPRPDIPEAALRPWLPPPVRLRRGGAPLLAELRPATALMLQFGGLDYEADAAGAQLDRYIRRVQQAVARYEGALVDVTMADKGGYLYAAFGATLAHEDDAARALRAALELRDLEVTPQQGAVRIGLSLGTMRAGPYGGVSRCAYGVLGDEVNMACRLMSAAAPGQILAGGQLQRAAAEGFAWRALPLMRVRGKPQEVEVYQLIGTLASAGRTPPRAAPLVGRAAERAALARAAQALRAGAGGVAVITGEPGIGKSRLVAELAEDLRAGGADLLSGAGLGAEGDAPYRAWRDLFSAYFGLGAASGPAERRARALDQARAAAPELAEQLPLLNDLLGLEIPDTPLTGALSGAARSERLGELLV